MKTVTVFLTHSPKDSIRVGTLVQTNEKKIFFEYDSKFISKNINLSPFKLDFRLGLQECHEPFLGNIHGIFNDSLPDGWGLMLIDRFLKKNGFDLREISHIDRLSFLGDRTIGALTYKPAIDLDDKKNTSIDLFKLSKNSIEILQGSEKEILPMLFKAGGSPGGARPKILVGVYGNTLISGESDLPDHYEPWIIKFRYETDFKDAGKIEYVYSKMAEMAGLIVPEHRLFEDNKNHYYFGTKRFDRNHNERIHFHSFGNLIHANFRIPSVDYELLLKICLKLTHDVQAVNMCYRLMIFNILSCNRDDHIKNVGFLMDKTGSWSFAPAYDLMFSLGMGGEHSMTIMGEGKNPSLHACDQLATLFQISNQEKTKIISDVKRAINQFDKLAERSNISKKDIKHIKTYHKKVANEGGF